MVKKTLIFISLVLVITTIIISIARPPLEKQKEKLLVKKEKPEKKPQPKPKVVKIVAMAEKKPSVTKDKEKNPSKSKPPKSVNKPKKKVSVKRQTFAKHNHKPQEKSKLHSASYKINRRIINDGKQMIENNKSIPIIQASYDRIGFDYYLARMKKLGGRLFVGDADQQKIVAEAITSDGGDRFHFVRLNKDLHRVGPISLFRPREITGENLVNQIISAARESFKNGDLRCVVLLPLDKEAAMLGALKNYLEKSKYHISQFDLAWGEYTRSAGNVGLRLNKARIRKTREIINMDMILTM